LFSFLIEKSKLFNAYFFTVQNKMLKGAVLSRVSTCICIYTVLIIILQARGGRKCSSNLSSQQRYNKITSMLTGNDGNGWTNVKSLFLVMTILIIFIPMEKLWWKLLRKRTDKAVSRKPGKLSQIDGLCKWFAGIIHIIVHTVGRFSCINCEQVWVYLSKLTR